MSSFAKIEVDGCIGRLTLDRPEKRNALTREFITDIVQGIERVKSSDVVRVLVIQASGKVFCAGMDLGEMQERAGAPNAKEEWRRDSEIYCEMLSAVYSWPIPTIAAVQGPVLAGGMGIVLATDMLIASDTVFFALPEPMRGITAAMVTPLLIHRIGAGAASYALLSGERVSAERGVAIGLCHDVVPGDQLTSRVDGLIESVLSGAPEALAITKRHIGACSHSVLIDQLKHSIQVSAEARETADAREGLAAFLEKRKPNWHVGP